MCDLGSHSIIYRYANMHITIHVLHEVKPTEPLKTSLQRLISLKYILMCFLQNKLMGKENTYFPNLVLLQLETPFRGCRMIRPVAFNVGMLSPRSTVVGWAHLPGTNVTLSYAVLVPMLAFIPFKFLTIVITIKYR